MSKKLRSAFLIILIIIVSHQLVLSRGTGKKFPILKGDYLGQKTPGLEPEIFAPGIVSTDKASEINAVFSPEGQEFYFSVRGPDKKYTIMVMKRENNQWTEPCTAPFSGKYSEADPFFSSDGKKLFFASKRPEPGYGPPHDIWVMEKTATGWSTPANPGPPVNSEGNELYPSVTRDGTLYFCSSRAGGHGRDDIYRCRLVKNRYTQAENLGGSISTEYDEGDVFIAADESYIIFVSIDRPDTYGSGDLYISFRKPDGNWSEAKNMGSKINSPAFDFCPIVSPDGRFFFFSKKGDVYWVDAKIIDQFRPSVLKGDYLGQKKPGLTPVIFAAGIVSTHKNELNAAFSPDGNELFFSISTPQHKYVLMHMKQVNGQWTMPQTAPFSGKYSDVDPSFSPDGKILFFSSYRPAPWANGTSTMDIWLVEKKESAWSEPYNAGTEINSYGDELHAVMSGKNNLYFASNRPGGKGGKDIYRSRFVNGCFTPPENLGNAVNSSYLDSDCCIAPNEDFLIFGSLRPGGFGKGDLYVCFRQKDGSWTPAKNMGKNINTPESEYAPILSPKGKFFFFTRKGPTQNGIGDVYWVDAAVIRELKQ